MADRIHAFPVAVPAGTLSTAPYTQALAFPLGTVTDVEIIVPPGPSGLLGFQIVHSGEPVIPHRGDAWIVTDNEHIKWPLRRFPVGSAWACRAYNTDVYAHTIQIRFLVDEIQREQSRTVPIIPIVPVIPQVVTE